MNPSVLAVILHIGHVVAAVKDIEKGIDDVIHGRATPADAKMVLQDIANLISDGIVAFPGLSKEQLTSAVQSLQSGLGIA